MESGVMPMVSVLIPCYNHEKFVKNCLESILHQDYSNYEVLLCDDASADRSFDIAEGMKRAFDEKKIAFSLYRNQENRGITKNLNFMLRRAGGKYIKIIASDDLLFPEYLSRMVSFMEERQQIQLAFSDVVKVREEAGYPVEGEYIIEEPLPEPPDCGDRMLERIYAFNFIPAPAMMIRRSVFDECGEYDENIGIEDWEMTMRILQKHPNGIDHLEGALVYYRINENSISSAKNNATAKKRLRFMHENSVAVAEKYKEAVGRKEYRKKMFRLYTTYLRQHFYLWRQKYLHQK